MVRHAATIKGLVIHGREPAGTEPLFTAGEVQAGLRIDSFWGRRISLNELVVQQPHVHIRVEKNGTTNVPEPPRAAASTHKPLRDTLFELRIRRLLLADGWLLYTMQRHRSRCMAEISGLGWMPGHAGASLYLGTLTGRPCSSLRSDTNLCRWVLRRSSRFGTMASRSSKGYSARDTPTSMRRRK